ncbi:PEP-CTERM sorting domain-containing protein [Pseudoduganella lutea]|uniref:PEP-CTERM sorting domain-containing protein n=1 Tax=Pseudoduganella lutea TaxID=321985 RepID=UPI0013EE9B79|nr:PEP-CTERM sorting domain-containing protein [Pseudoduganella lutea]
MGSPFATAHYGFSQGATNLQAFATITSLTRVDIQSPVPEPATWGMLGLGLGMLAFVSRK